MDRSQVPPMPELPEPFGLYRRILGVSHLHFGLWPPDEPGLSLEHAQQRMFELLLEFFPGPPAAVLDVGCGLGLSAELLAQRGYQVTAIALSREMIEYARRTYPGTRVDFRALDFFDSDESIFAARRYNVILFQESAQYLRSLLDALKKAHWLLDDRGVVILSDEVCRDPAIEPMTAVHASSAITCSLLEAGYRIVEQRKLDTAVQPTCDRVIEAFSARAAAHAQPPSRAEDDSLRFYLEGWKKQKDWHTSGRMGYEVFVGKKDRFVVQSYVPGDEEEILRLFKEVFHADRTEAHWQWKFRDNPWGSYKVSCARSGEGELVAHFAGYPIRFFSAVGGVREFLGFQLGDTMTRPSARRVGLGTTALLARTFTHFSARFSREADFFYGFNTGHIKKFGTRYLGYEYLGPVSFRVGTPARRPRSLTWALGKLLSGFRVAEVRELDEEWELFFERVAASYGFLVRRDRQYVQWRYLDCPDRVHRLLAVRRWGRLVGWAVFTARGSCLRWGDGLFDCRYPEAVAALLREAVTRTFPGVDRIECWFSTNPGWWSELLDRNGFVETPEPSDLHVAFLPFDRKALEASGVRDRLYYTMGDSDLF